MKYPLIIITIICCQLNSIAQNTDRVLQSIESNNLQLKAQVALIQNQKLSSKIGLLPDNPTVEYGYFPGNKSDIGTKKTLSISQSFDFPTTYFYKNKISKDIEKQTEYNYQSIQQEILLQASLTCNELTALNKRDKVLKKRLKSANTIYQSYQKRLKQGDASVLNMNKAKLHLLNIKTKKSINESLINRHLQILIQLNGGEAINFSDTIYKIQKLLARDSIIAEVIASNPNLKSIQTERSIAIKNHKLTKSQWLPSFTIGYESETILDETFAGLKAGLSIPLWNNRGKTKAAKSKISYTENLAAYHENKLTSETNQQYEIASQLQKNMTEYNETITQLNNTALLDKALKLGQLSILEYFVEIAFFYDMFDTYLQLEKDYHQSLILLYKYRTH